TLLPSIRISNGELNEPGFRMDRHRPRIPQKLPVVLSADKIVRFAEAVRIAEPGVCNDGLCLICRRRWTRIDSARILIRVEQRRLLCSFRLSDLPDFASRSRLAG